MQLNLTARIDRETRDVRLFDDGHQFGVLRNVVWCHMFESDDHDIAAYMVGRIEPDMSLREMLAEVRAGYTGWRLDQEAEAKLEQDAENAWLREAEYDWETQEQMRRDDEVDPTLL